MKPELDAAIRELEEAARELRTPEIDADRAAGLVDRCAEIAARIGATIDDMAREVEREAPSAGQERLL
jgi:hypothetical protein